MGEIRVVMKKPLGAKEKIKFIKNTVDGIQDAVGGYFQVVGHPELENIAILCDEEGKLKHKEQNIWMENLGFGGEWLVGDVIFVGCDREEFVSLTDEQIEKIHDFIWSTDKDDSEE